MYYAYCNQGGGGDKELDLDFFAEEEFVLTQLMHASHRVFSRRRHSSETT